MLSPESIKDISAEINELRIFTASLNTARKKGAG
jgi:hypothetical protein